MIKWEEWLRIYFYTLVSFTKAVGSDTAILGCVCIWCILVSQAIRIFPRAHARGKGGGGREGKIRLVRCARFSFHLPECWQSQ